MCVSVCVCVYIYRCVASVSFMAKDTYDHKKRLTSEIIISNIGNYYFSNTGV
jgi:hypothetical protein